MLMTMKSGFFLKPVQSYMLFHGELDKEKKMIVRNLERERV